MEIKFVQVAPQRQEEIALRRSPGQSRAVVLIHGLQIRPITTANITKANLQGWQRPDSKLVEIMEKCADVYAFGYSQNVAIEEIAGVPGLGDNIRRLQVLGYADIVLIGHSAGGLIARQFVEDYPDAGVTKVIQVCAPNLGATFAHFEPGVPKVQRAFLHSLTKDGRAHVLSQRAGKKIPETVQFVCVVGDGTGFGDFVVANNSQWPRDLQEQGVPVFPLRTVHFTVMRTQATIQRLAELVCQYEPRWSASRVAIAKKELVGAE